MRKHSKFITILLSALLAVCLVQTVFVQAFATENSATPDEPTEDLYPVSMEVVKSVMLLGCTLLLLRKIKCKYEN